MPDRGDASRTGSGDRPYYDDVNIYDYDETIVAHPYMDQVKAAMLSDLISVDKSGQRALHVLDAGTGSGQLARSILGAGFQNVALADADSKAAAFCGEHPELAHLPFHLVDFSCDDLGTLNNGRFDIVCLLGVYHHISPGQRVAFLRRLARLAPHVLIGDEGILEYDSEEQRKANARAWYGFVISESRRRGIEKLAALEERFLASDVSEHRGAHDDFKESPTAVLSYAASAGYRVVRQTRLGDWERYGGGMYSVLLASS